MFRPICIGRFWFYLLLISMASAQESINYASVSGRVTDPTGAVIEGASVTAHQIDTNLASHAKTDREGRFRLPYLKPGQYEITVRLQGFADVVRPVTLTVGAAFELPHSPSSGPKQTRVGVTDEP